MEESIVIYAWHFLLSGGPVMLALFILSFALYKNVLGLLIFVLRSPKIEGTVMSDSTKVMPAERIERERRTCNAIRRQYTRIVQDRLKFTHALIIGAPLLGLLGTVVGMLYSFHGLSMQAGHETARVVADGVSRALVTTQTGLTIAIPALFLSQSIRRIAKKHEQRLEHQWMLLSRNLNASKNAQR
jgi:biopolymer transport protein ExbB/TolQ